MRFLIVFLLLLGSYSAQSQQGISIEYERQSLKKLYPAQYSRFVFNDSFAFYYFFLKGYDPLKKSLFFSKSILHHAIFYNKQDNIIYNHVNLPLGNTFLVTDTIKTNSWVTVPGEKNILGYKCISAINEDSKRGVTKIWYTSVLGTTLGHPWYAGLPGIPLEIIDFDRNWKITATSVSYGKFQFALPDQTILTRSEYNNRLEKKQY